MTRIPLPSQRVLPCELSAMLDPLWTRLAKLRGRPRTASVQLFVDGADGASAVEFALIAAPFLALLFAILETALIFFSGQVLEAAVQDSARLIFTGQAQNAGYSQQQFKDQVCAK